MFGDVREYFRKWSGWILFTVLILYYELLFHGMNFSLDDGNIAAIIAFVVVVGGVFSVLTGFFRRSSIRYLQRCSRCLRV